MFPLRYASDFGSLSGQNCIPSSLMGRGLVGAPATFIPSLGTPLAYPPFSHGVDVRTNLSKYSIYHGEKLFATVDDVSEYWKDQNVVFLFRCSYPFDAMLAQVGFAPRCHVASTAIPMYRTTLPLNSEPGTAIISMRPYRLSDVPRIREIIATYRMSIHGHPNVWGLNGAEMLGVEDIAFSEWSDAMEFVDDEAPALWSYEVNPQNFLMGLQEGTDGVVVAQYSGGMLTYDLCED